tara:strand:- start:239 stop:1012 length:774 start_codon:yes stop_codon:yes gene_type:complete
MKKILAVICFSFLSLNLANAEILSFGVSGNVGMLKADGKETITGTSERATTGSGAGVVSMYKEAGTSTTQISKASEEVYIGYVSLFGEAHILDSGLRLGLSYVPYALESETTDNARNNMCTNNDGKVHVACTVTNQTVQIDVEDLVTLYVAYHHEVDLGFVDSVFIKAGIMEADIITKEKLASGSEYGNTILEGQLLGLGAEKNLDDGMFVRFEANMTQYDSIKLSNLNTADHENDNTIEIDDLDGATATLSIGKSF